MWKVTPLHIVSLKHQSLPKLSENGDFMSCSSRFPPPPTRSAEDDGVDLESLLDDTIVETTWRRRVYPRRILPHVVHSLKAERKLVVGVAPRGLWSCERDGGGGNKPQLKTETFE